jgi:hypothetical protein
MLQTASTAPRNKGSIYLSFQHFLVNQWKKTFQVYSARFGRNERTPTKQPGVYKCAAGRRQ